jgi:uncharacterized protein (DUF302 family)
MAADGLTTIPSHYGAKETADRLEAEIRAKGTVVFARIDHAAGAAQAGLALGPTEVLIFGNAKAGTPLMQSNQTIGIDLPLKALVWQDASGKVWLSYNEPSSWPRRSGKKGHAVDAAATNVCGATGSRREPKRRSMPWRYSPRHHGGVCLLDDGATTLRIAPCAVAVNSSRALYSSEGF